MRTAQEKLFEEYANLLKTSGQQVHEHLDGVKAVLEQASQLQTNVSEGHKSLKEIANAMSLSGSALEKASLRLDSFAVEIKESIERNSQNVGKSAALLDNIGKRQAEVIANLQELLRQSKSAQTGLIQSSDKLTSSIVQVMAEFNNLSGDYERFRNDLLNNFTDIQKMAEKQGIDLANHMANLLRQFGSDLSKGINERMNEWNEQTRTFCDNMTGIVQIMSDVVDGLDDGQTDKANRRGS